MADPVSWLVIERGWKVLAADGTEVGSVDELIGDTGKDIFNGLSVSTGLLKRSRYVPSERVIAILEGVVQLDLAAHQIDGLDAHRDQPPSAEIRPG